MVYMVPGVGRDRRGCWDYGFRTIPPPMASCTIFFKAEACSLVFNTLTLLLMSFSLSCSQTLFSLFLPDVGLVRVNLCLLVERGSGCNYSSNPPPPHPPYLNVFLFHTCTRVSSHCALCMHVLCVCVCVCSYVCLCTRLCSEDIKQGCHGSVSTGCAD